MTKQQNRDRKKYCHQFNNLKTSVVGDGQFRNGYKTRH